MLENNEVLGSETTNRRASRLTAVDAVRGLIIALMALHHANHFIAHKHPPGEYWGGGFPVYYDALTFVTRLVTHLAPSGFFLLMGVGMVRFADSRRRRGWTEWAIIKHFLTRGVVLVALQLMLVNRAWELHPSGWGLEIYIGVLVALGGSMILGSLLVRLRTIHLLALTGLLVLGAELLTPDPGQWNQAFPAALRVLLIPGGSPELWVNFPVLQWLELAVLGMALGHLLAKDAGKAYQQALKAGATLIVAFVVACYLDGFGNILPRMGNDWIDFLNVVKYPPSIAYILLTKGTNLTILGLFGLASQKVERFLQPLATFGRTPLFFYITHLFLYLGLGLLVAPNGTSIPVMYPFCLWYARFKQRQPAGSVFRFL